jgi:hypothetical protein
MIEASSDLGLHWSSIEYAPKKSRKSMLISGLYSTTGDRFVTQAFYLPKHEKQWDTEGFYFANCPDVLKGDVYYPEGWYGLLSDHSFCGHHLDKENYEIKHWMPLPDAPEGQ